MLNAWFFTSYSIAWCTMSDSVSMLHIITRVVSVLSYKGMFILIMVFMVASPCSNAVLYH